MNKPSPLTIVQILLWADAYRAERGAWPKTSSGPVRGAGDDTWAALDAALRRGSRGLPGGSSLAQMLDAERGVRNKKALPRLTLGQIRDWAETHRRRTGLRPGAASGPIPEAPGESWLAVEMALVQGHRGLPGGSSLAKLLGKARGRKEPTR